METIANIFLFIAGEALCVAAFFLAARLGYCCLGNLTWDSFYSKNWSGPVLHYAGNIGFLALAIALLAISIAFAVTIPYILWGAA
jgi:hypothetical protein